MTTVSVWILGDQLLLDHPALGAAEQIVEQGTERSRIRVVLIESRRRLARRPYQRKKLVLLLSAMRHYVRTLSAAGYPVDYMRAEDVGTALAQHVAAHKPTQIVTMAAAEFAGRRFQEERLAALLNIPVTVLPNSQFLVGHFDPYAGRKRSGKRAIMGTFYRAMRRHFGILLEEDGGPAGGTWNYDRKNG